MAAEAQVLEQVHQPQLCLKQLGSSELLAFPQCPAATAHPAQQTCLVGPEYLPQGMTLSAPGLRMCPSPAVLFRLPPASGDCAGPSFFQE
jgi:hypothetical protein